ncbi:dihydrofolate reductase [Arthrobacter sp. JUb119]|uniref:dihydrofolate reductase family protein n=1 Tax=unclassified Arthrobacter TaxID=235627 RepID=UPI000CFBF8D1|nr:MULTISPECIES: dihydrofolate reductase family protein [unclassified Arthrobacter]MCS3492889.1 dihydrofolate reductase [Arthrobacter sp. JUb119]PQZ90657.1 riboflavin biosynthesis protein RibD [Arthrobacter sp. MYb222]PRB75762.1 riboflavin biosynthesis protein RibD [Arthrobacter sp. MYb214]
MRELTYFVAVSLDGYIAGPHGEFDAFAVAGDHAAPIWDRYRGTAPTQLAESAGLPIEGCPFDTVLMGWNTYAVGLPALPSPYSHLRQIVFTREHSSPPGSQEVQFTSADPREVIGELKSQPGDGIWLCGGGQLAARLRPDIDRLALKVQPVMFGSGIKLFGDTGYAPDRWRLENMQSFASGVCLAEYSRG